MFLHRRGHLMSGPILGFKCLNLLFPETKSASLNNFTHHDNRKLIEVL